MPNSFNNISQKSGNFFYEKIHEIATISGIKKEM